MTRGTVQATPRSCDHLALPGAARPNIQELIAARAFALWLERGFRNGSPQEDWLRAQREVTAAARRTSREVVQ